MLRKWHSAQNSCLWWGLLLLLSLEIFSIFLKRTYLWKHFGTWHYPSSSPSSKYVCSTAQSLRLSNMCGITQHSPAPTQNSCWWRTNSSIYNSLAFRATMFVRRTWEIFHSNPAGPKAEMGLNLSLLSVKDILEEGIEFSYFAWDIAVRYKKSLIVTCNQ